MKSTSHTSRRLLRRKEVEEQTGLSKAAIYRGIREGTFPQPVSLGPRMVAWPESAINEWIDNKLVDYDPGYRAESR
ncbi:AlpA family transcriptional regulator [Thiohalophilus sp.]|uniref:helix-turn-helix transcriptional regulator n=1 Tax=Thiohalophilus sp. TaxID=3028392 RepID=UPI002ACD587C|nr:AlpA family transcriptional regulator [Thiohalophilus sp.]MDZ7803147.1 AlpA family transcriptional regulator [Thiohalophilus sp.]